MPFVNFKKFYMRLISCLIFFPPFCSTDSSSSSSDDSPARSVQSAAVPAPTSQLLSSLEKDEPRKSFGIKVQNLPVRSTGRILCYSTFLSAAVGEWEIEQLKFYTLYRICLNSSLSYLTVLVIFSICLSIWLSPPFSFCGSLIFNAV